MILSNICIVARTKKLVDDYIAQITRAGLRAYEIKRSKTEDRSRDGVRVATMHRVKGLEFQYVFIAAVNNRVIPLPSAINRTDTVSEMETLTSEKCLLYVALTRAQKGAYNELWSEVGISVMLKLFGACRVYEHGNEYKKKDKYYFRIQSKTLCHSHPFR